MREETEKTATAKLGKDLIILLDLLHQRGYIYDYKLHWTTTLRLLRTTDHLSHADHLILMKKNFEFRLEYPPEHNVVAYDLSLVGILLNRDLPND